MIWPFASQIEEITDHQRAELHKATRGVIGILGGSPGCGKTYVAGKLIKQMAKQVGVANILVGAPTGKAAVRMTETLAAAGIAIRCRTWHSILMLGDANDSETKPIAAKVLIGDESSMLDLGLFCAIMRARPKGCHFLVIGDVHQLPPVGRGAPLRDLIRAGLPYGELREIMRNSGGIVEACAAIRDAKPWSEGGNLKIAASSSPQAQVADILDAIRTAKGDGLDPVWDCQVVVPVNAKSDVSRKSLNTILQDELNPGVGTGFRVNDKIVNTKNGNFPLVEGECENDRGEAYVANGELARVVEVHEKHLIAELKSPLRVIRIPRGESQSQDSAGEGDGVDSDKTSATGCSWELGYALSAHKCQGSEWPVAIVVIDEYAGAKRICSSEWLYTAISRAKQRCVIVGKKATADSFCRQVAIGKRKTFLRELIHLESAARTLERM